MERHGEFADFVGQNLSVKPFLERFCPTLGPITINEGDNIQLWCPFHNKEIPPSAGKSRSFSISSKGEFLCYSCGKRGRSLVGFYALLFQIPLSKAAVDLYEEFVERCVPMQEVDAAHDLLLRTPKVLEFLNKKKGLAESTIKKFSLGYKGTRITIPIFDAWGFCVNVRLYSQDSKTKFLNMKGYGALRLYPEPNPATKEVYLFEGEWDMMLASQLGLPAVTATGGARGWSEKFNSKFEGKEVKIVYDNDAAGKEGARQVAEQLSKVASKIYIGDLGLGGAKEDFSDFILKYGKTLDLIEWEEYKINITKLPVVPLASAGGSEWYNKDFILNSTVIGKDMAPYLLPKQIAQRCPSIPNKKLCLECSLVPEPPRHTLNLDLTSEDCLELCGTPSVKVRKWLQKRLGIPLKCPCSLEATTTYQVERLQLIPSIDSSDSSSPYTTRMGYCIGTDIVASKSYAFQATTLPEPKAQRSTHILRDAVYVNSDIENFKMTEELNQELSVFKAEKGEVYYKLRDIADHLATNITHIFDREDLHIAIDLALHSLREFYFGQEDVTRGWINCLIIGDTRTGKGQVASRLCSYYHAGEFVSSENCSYPGLVGGVQPTLGGTWIVTWGRIVLNDSRAVVVDELSAMLVEDIGRLSRVRSEGIAEITKIQFQKAFARTRLIFLSNPRDGRTMDSFDYGVEAVPHLMGRTEDVARLDYVLGVAWSEVQSSRINCAAPEPIDSPYTSEACSSLILWAWSRKKTDIKFSPEAIEFILETSRDLGDRYSSAIPLLQPEDARLKLARIAASVAARVFSTTTGEDVVVGREHAQVAYTFLDSIYTKSSFAYKSYSKLKSTSGAPRNHSEEEIDMVLEIVKEDQEAFVVGLLSQDKVAVQDICNLANLTKEDAMYLLGRLVRLRALTREHAYYKKNSWFIRYLRQRSISYDTEGKA